MEPQLSLITLFPPETAGSRSAGYTGGRANIHAVQFPGDTGESIFQVRHGESRNILLLMDGGIRTHDPKTHGLSTTPFVEELRRAY